MIRYIRTTLALFVASTALLANAQYTDRAAMNDLGGPKEFAARRTELAAKLKTGYVLLFAKTQEPPADSLSRGQRLLLLHRALRSRRHHVHECRFRQRPSLSRSRARARVQVYGANLLSMSKDEQKDLGLYQRACLYRPWIRHLSFLFGSGVDNDLWVRLGFADKPDGARFETGRDYAAEYNNPYGQELARRSRCAR